MPDIVTDISLNQNWNARKGTNNPVTFTFTQNSAAFNISGYTFSVQLRRFGRDENLLNLTQGSGITNNGALGTLDVVFTSSNLTNIVANDYYWQMSVVHPDTFTYIWFQGTFNLFSELYSGDLTTAVRGTIDVNGTTIYCSISLPVSGSNANAWVSKGNWDGSTNVFPSTSVLSGYLYKNTANSTTLLMEDGGIIPRGAIIVANVDNPGQTVANWDIFLTVK